jgi:hypothetical protein
MPYVAMLPTRSPFQIIEASKKEGYAAHRARRHRWQEANGGYRVGFHNAAQRQFKGARLAVAGGSG